MRRLITTIALLFVIFCVLCALFVLCSIIYYLTLSFLVAEPIDRAYFGDSFGGLNALFSGLALAGVITALILQQHDLGVQITHLSRVSEAQRDAGLALRTQAMLLALEARIRACAVRAEYGGRDQMNAKKDLVAAVEELDRLVARLNPAEEE